MWAAHVKSDLLLCLAISIVSSRDGKASAIQTLTAFSPSRMRDLASLAIRLELRDRSSYSKLSNGLISCLTQGSWRICYNYIGLAYDL